MSITIRIPDADSCNGCSSNQAVIAIRFMATDYSGLTVRLCQKCRQELAQKLNKRQSF